VPKSSNIGATFHFLYNGFGSLGESVKA